ncbi:MAG: hypothetical protein DMD89_05740 [Candidatus Rokuibacteriota bacterium]|nr:MAG: hypothetical protein DMD89_05740 [Candidatus Rokubacteria bacterium]
MFGLRLLLREPAGHDDVVAEAAEPARVPGDALRKIGKDNRIRARVVRRAVRELPIDDSLIGEVDSDIRLGDFIGRFSRVGRP